MALYREALDHYGATYGVRLEGEKSNSAQRLRAVDDAVLRLTDILPEGQKATIRGMPESDLIHLHFAAPETPLSPTGTLEALMGDRT